MTAPLSLRDKQIQFLVGQYGPGLSYADMLSKYYGGGNKSLSDLAKVVYPGSGSLADNMDAAISGTGSLTDQMYADASGGISSSVDPIADGPTPLYSFWAGDKSVTVNDGDLITNWKTLSNTGGTARPVYTKANALFNGQQSLDFNGTSNYLQQDVTDQAQPYYAVAIVSGSILTGGRGAVGFGGAGVSGVTGIGIRSSNGNWFIAAQSSVLDSGTVAVVNKSTLISGKLAGAASDVQVNALTTVVGNGGTDGLTWFKVGVMGIAGGLSSYWQGSINFAAIYTVDPRLDAKWPKILEHARKCGVAV